MPDLLGKDLMQASEVSLCAYLRGLLKKKYRLADELELIERRADKVRAELARRRGDAGGTTGDVADWQGLAAR